MVEIDSIQNPLLYSICSLVTNTQEYKEMTDSFKKAGFSNKECEFLYIDNSQKNKYDGYSGLQKFLATAKGKYIILCHQDILLQFDDRKVLEEKIKQIDAIDPNWAILGNAGYKNFNDVALRITDPHDNNRNFPPFPAKVYSVDENFMLIKKEANLSVSNDISGFHLYGTDLSLIASILGYTTYVIDFHLYHKSAGTCGTNFYSVKKQMIQSYTKKLQFRALRTPCTMMFLTPFTWLNKLCNTKLCYSIKKRLDTLSK